MAIDKLNKTVVSGERARATDFNLVTEKVDEVIGQLNINTATLPNKAAISHTHEQTDITGLSDALDGKSDVDHTHETSDVNGLDAYIGKSLQFTSSSSSSGTYIGGSFTDATLNGIATGGYDIQFIGITSSLEIVPYNFRLGKLKAESGVYYLENGTFVEYVKASDLTSGSIVPAKATKATKDGSGNTISTTYIKKTDAVTSLDVSAVFSASVGDTISTLSTILDSNVKLYAGIDGIFVDVNRGISHNGNHMVFYHDLNSDNELQTQYKLFTMSDGVITIIQEGDQ